MKNAGVAIPTYNVEEPKVPFILNKQRNLFKLFQNDVGLLAYQYADGIQLRILSGDVKEDMTLRWPMYYVMQKWRL